MRSLKPFFKKKFRLLALLLCLAATIPQLRADIIVAGSNTSLFGGSWTTTTNSSNLMTQLSGTNYYYLAKTNVSLSGTTEWKVVDNGSWYPGSNQSFNATGTRSIVFIYDKSNHNVSSFGPFQTLTVAGSQTEILGSSWGQTDSNNDMSTTDGITYTLSFTDVHVTANNYEFKVVQDHSWSNAWPSSNKTYSIGFTGTADVTFTFNVVTKDVSVTVTEKSVTPVTPHYYVTGDNGLGLNGFTYQPTLELTDPDEDGIYTYTSTATADGTYNFVFANGQGSDWNNFNNTYRIGPTTSNTAVSLNTYQSTQLAGGDHGAYQVTVAAGTVTFHFNPTAMTFMVQGTAPVIITDYYVVGDIFPNGWNTGASTQMTDNDNDGTYTWTSGQMHLDAGTNYEYKVLDSNGTYYPSGANATFNVAVPGTYTVTVTIDSSNGTVNAVATLVQADPTYNYTFYVLPDDSSVTPTLYLWGTNNNSYHPNGDWPGTAMGSTEVLADDNTWYKYTGALYANLMNAIVNVGSNAHQTQDITSLAPGTYYIYWYVNDNDYDLTTTAPTPAPTYDYTIYVRYKGNGTPYMYMWDGAGVKPLGDFPGTNVNTFTSETINGYTYYKYIVTGSKYSSLGVILNEGSGAGQTENVTVYPGTSYLTYGGNNVYSGPNAQADPAMTYYAESNFFGWTTDGTLMTANGDGSYSKTFSGITLNAGQTYEYKVWGNDGTNEGVWYGDNGNNATFSPSHTGTYDVTITLNSDGTVSHTLTMTGAPAFYIIGSEGIGLTWTARPTTSMTFDTNTGYYNYTFTVTNGGSHGFVFANGMGSSSDDWENFNNNYRIGPTNGNDTTDVNSGWHQTQQAHGDHGSYQVYLAPGTYTISYDSSTSQYRITGPQTIYILGDPGLGLDWNYVPTQTMAYDATTGYYTYSFDIAKEDVFYFSFANGQARGLDHDNNEGWSTFNYHYRIGPTGDADERYLVGTDNWMSTQHAVIPGGTPAYSYYAKMAMGRVTIYFDYANGDDNNMRFRIVTDSVASADLYMLGGFTCDSIQHYYNANDGALMKYDKAKKLYYLNHVVLNTNATFCFTTLLGSSSDDWANVGTRYGNSDTDENYYHAPEGEGQVGHLKYTDDKDGIQMPLDVWQDALGEWKMYTAGIYNVVVSIEEGWVKLIKTDQFNLFPMNVYLRTTTNQNHEVTIDESQPAGSTYENGMFNGGLWPLCAYNRLMGGWDPSSDSNHYSVSYEGIETDENGEMWYHWQVSASICEIFFNVDYSNQHHITDTIERKAGVLWVVLNEEDDSFTDVTREHFDFSATRLPGNVVVEEGHCYVYFVNTVGWQTVYFVAWDDVDNHAFTDAYGNDLEDWPGHVMTCVGIDPDTGYEVWEYDLGPVDDMANQEPAGVIFHDGTPNPTTDAKEQTGDAEYINGGVYDYLGLMDDAYTLDNLIRFAADSVRYTVSDDLLGVYYDEDAVTRIHYKDKFGNDTYEDIYGALYAKDMNKYSEPSIQPEGTYDYVYDICNTNHTVGGSQVMMAKTEYDQSNWVKLVMSPNYDGGGAEPVNKKDRPYLRNYVDKIIPGGELHIFMTDTINPTAHVLKIGEGVAADQPYEPNVYISGHFNDTVVFNYVHKDWQPKRQDGKEPYPGNRRTKAYVTWHYDNMGNVTYGTVKREFVDSIYYKMFYVAPKPQEIAYLTWIVYDNDNEDGAYGYYNHDSYFPTTTVARQLPEDEGRFFAPMNWNRSQTIPGGWKGLSENELEDSLGGYGKLYGPYSNGYAQYGGVKVNWSLFGDSANHVITYKDKEYPWWEIFEPGQAYKIKAIIRYARSDSVGHQNNECYAPGNGDEGDNEHVNVLNAPRREYVDNGQGGYANMYFTGDYAGLESSKFIIFPIDASPAGSNGTGLGNVTTVKEVTVPRKVVGVKYYNLMGIESDKPFEGINIVVTFYNDGSRTSKKILR